MTDMGVGVVGGMLTGAAVAVAVGVIVGVVMALCWLIVMASMLAARIRTLMSTANRSLLFARLSAERGGVRLVRNNWRVRVREKEGERR